MKRYLKNGDVVAVHTIVDENNKDKLILGDTLSISLYEGNQDREVKQDENGYYVDVDGVYYQYELDDLVIPSDHLGDAVEEEIVDICNEKGWDIETVEYSYTTQVFLTVKEGETK